MSMPFDNCFLCNTPIDEAFLRGINGYDVSLWTSLCKVFQVSAEEFNWKTFTSCRLCYSCHSLAVQSTEVLKKIKLLQIELEELSKTLKDVFKESITLEVKQESDSPIESNAGLSLRTLLSERMSDDLDGGNDIDIIQVMPVFKEDFDSDDGGYQLLENEDVGDANNDDCHDNSSTELQHGVETSNNYSPDSVNLRLEPSTKRQPLKDFRTFMVQGYVLKDLEIKLERLSQNHSFNVPATHSASPDFRNRAEGVLLACNDDDDSGDDSSWVGDSSSEASSDDGYGRRKRKTPAAFRKQRKQEHSAENGNGDEEKFQCQVCMKVSNSLRNLRRHMELHEGKNHICEICDGSFKTNSQLRLHKKRRHERDKTCKVCGKAFAFNSQLKQHERSHHGEGNQEDAECQCQICLKVFKSKRGVQRHMEYHREGSHVCDRCGKTYKVRALLKKHMSRHHPENPEEDCLTCKVCETVLSSRLELLQHVRRNHVVTKHICETCGKSFVEAANLKRHMFTHSEEKPFTCDLCGKRVTDLPFHRVSCLEKRSSAEEKRFQCSHCDKTFYQELSLKRHEYIHLNPDRFQCDVCKKKFRLKCLLVEHRRSHSLDDRIPCTMCSARFRRPQDLKWHIEYDHLGNRDKCSICGYEAKSRNLFKIHERKHKVGRQYECDLCRKKFLTRYHMRRHRRTHELSKNAMQVNEDEENVLSLASA